MRKAYAAKLGRFVLGCIEADTVDGNIIQVNLVIIANQYQCAASFAKKNLTESIQTNL